MKGQDSEGGGSGSWSVWVLFVRYKDNLNLSRVKHDLVVIICAHHLKANHLTSGSPNSSTQKKKKKNRKKSTRQNKVLEKLHQNKELRLKTPFICCFVSN